MHSKIKNKLIFFFITLLWACFVYFFTFYPAHSKVRQRSAKVKYLRHFPPNSGGTAC